MDKNQSGIHLLPGSGPAPSAGEAEARLHQEGYESFRWHDVPGSNYPRHRHDYDECIWILEGEISFQVEGPEGYTDYRLRAGDRLYLPARTAHTALVPATASVTYLVGQRRS